MYFIYLLRSIPYPNRKYIGYTIDLKTRLTSHNHGKPKHTNKFKVCKLVPELFFLDHFCLKLFESVYISYRSCHSPRTPCLRKDGCWLCRSDGRYIWFSDKTYPNNPIEFLTVFSQWCIQLNQSKFDSLVKVQLLCCAAFRNHSTYD